MAANIAVIVFVFIVLFMLSGALGYCYYKYSHPETIKPVEGIPWWAYGKPPPQKQGDHPHNGTVENGFVGKPEQPTVVKPVPPSSLNASELDEQAKTAYQTNPLYTPTDPSIDNMSQDMNPLRPDGLEDFGREVSVDKFVNRSISIHVDKSNAEDC